MVKSLEDTLKIVSASLNLLRRCFKVIKDIKPLCVLDKPLMTAFCCYFTHFLHQPVFSTSLKNTGTYKMTKSPFCFLLSGTQRLFIAQTSPMPASVSDGRQKEKVKSY